MVKMMIFLGHSWLSYLLSLFLCFALLWFFFFPTTKTKSKSKSKTRTRNLPPGPPPILTIFSVIKWLRKDLLNMKPMLRHLRDKYGPIFTLNTSKPTIFISDHTLAHTALIRHGTAIVGRDPTFEISIAFSPYGPRWRTLRRNLASQLLHPSRIKQFADARNWALQVLLDELETQAAADSSGDGAVRARESFRFSMLCLMVLMCFGEKLDFGKIREIEYLHNSIHNEFYVKAKIFAMFPMITRILFRREWKMLFDLRRKQEEMFIPLIRARGGRGGEGGVRSYVDSLLELSLAEEGGRRLTEAEMVSLCSEVLRGGISTTTTVLEWIMAELVKNPRIQERLWEEIRECTGDDQKQVMDEEDMSKMLYLKAVVLEGLRRHPSGQLLPPHVATEDVEIGGYAVPKGTAANFMVGEMGLDGKVWDEPMEFRPERFLSGGEGEGVDITGSREIKMMPFGAGRRICPGLGFAMLHLEYSVGNLVREFEWRAVEGEEVDLSEKLELTVVMKNHLRAKIVRRREKNNNMG